MRRSWLRSHAEHVFAGRSTTTAVAPAKAEEMYAPEEARPMHVIES
jgi:hypothetical protein